jgi:hypothetical protein
MSTLQGFVEKEGTSMVQNSKLGKGVPEKATR